MAEVNGKPMRTFSAIGIIINQNRKKMKKFLSFFLLALCIIGALGGVIVTLTASRYEITIGILGLAYTACPKFKQYWYDLNFS